MTPTRRTFLESAAAPFLVTSLDAAAPAPPWYRRVVRWGQTNISELDPEHYDLDWWRQHWKRTGTQGVVINAGGIVAYYPSRLPLQYRAQFLKDRDLYGELARAAHADGLVVFARMDSNRAAEPFYQAHPDWFAIRVDRTPYRAGDRYIACIDGPYYDEYLPGVLREIIAWERPEGFTDNSWSGLGRSQICYCRHSRERFRRATGRELPARKDWDDPDFREWIRWSYARRLEVWDLNNRVAREAGGEHCLWVGMIGGDFANQGERFRDIKAICERSEMVMLDDQGRRESIGFLGNAEIGKRLHGVLGWDKIIPESMATYQRSPVFRKSAASLTESRMWMYAGFAGGIQPWWHHVGAYQADRRQFATAEPVYHWHARCEEFLMNRRPMASVGIVYSQQNADFFGRDNAEELVGQPYYGWIQALVRARIPYLPVHIDHLDRDAPGLEALILPNLAAMTDAQAAAVERAARAGKSLIASGETGCRNEWGEPRERCAVGHLFGVAPTGKRHGSLGAVESWDGGDHTYLRLHPDAGREIYGPKSGEEPPVSPPRHEVLRGFEATDILPFGGLLLEVEAAQGTQAPITFVPSFPAYPPEFSWMRTPRTNIAALVLREENRARCAWLAADVDRCFARDNLPDHGDLLANLVRWALRGDTLLEVEGAGSIDCHLYRQDDRLVLHLVNLTNPGAWRSPVHELIPAGPFTVRVRLPEGLRAHSARLLVAGVECALARRGPMAHFQIERILAHEVAVLG